MDECFLSFKFDCGHRKKVTLSKGGRDRIQSMIDSSKDYGDGKHVELQQILDTSQNPTVLYHRDCASTYCSTKSREKARLAKRGMHPFIVIINLHC